MTVKRPAKIPRGKSPKSAAQVAPIFLDTSVVLRWMLNEAEPVSAHASALFYASALLRVESRRTLDRLHRQGQLSDTILGHSEHWLVEFERQVARVPVTETLLLAAALPLRTVVGTLDALHLVSAIATRDAGVANLTFATHDRQLGTAAAAHGFDVVGLA